MVDKEKVIKGLGEILRYCHEMYSGCDNDGQYKLACMNQAAKDALALLKAQEQEVVNLQTKVAELTTAREPRVMTLEEVKMLDSDYYYLESMRSPGKELREIVGAYGLTCVTWPSITWARQTMGDSGYRKTWRCWTSRPTDEQREATSWETI